MPSIFSSGSISDVEVGGTLERIAGSLPVAAVERSEPLMMRNLFLNVAQLHVMFAYRKEGRQTFKLSPSTAALRSQDLNCKNVWTPGDAALGVVAPDTTLSNP